MDINDPHFWRIVTVVPFLFLMSGVLVGYLRIFLAAAHEHRPAVAVFSASLLIILGLLAGRSAWAAFVGPVPELGGVGINIVGCIGTYLALKALHLMIPEDERNDWHWYSAPAYPPTGLIGRLVGIVRPRR